MIRDLQLQYLPESTRLLYTQLLSDCVRGTAPSRRGLSFVSKKIGGGKHWYLQLTIGSEKSQHYLGPDSDELMGRIAEEKTLWERAEPDIGQRQKLVSMLISGGAHTIGAEEARVLEILERTGVFLVDGVLVGSHAFSVYGNMLGIRWTSEVTRTHDVDIAADYRIRIGMADKKSNLRQALMDSEMGFFEVPSLNRKTPSTRFKIRGRQLSVDILAPMIGKTSSRPVHLSVLDVYAEPVRFLDYLLVDTQPAVIVAKAGILVNVPAPARYALHKLVTAQRRAATMQTKTLKDIGQAVRLIEVLLKDRPGDLSRAWKAARSQPEKFMTQLRSGIKKLPVAMQADLKKTVGR